MDNSRHNWIKIALLWVIIGLLGWHAIKPFIAERYYREGFNNSALKRYAIAIKQLEKATQYAPWEVHYRSALGKAYESAADTRQSFKEKNRLLRQAITAYQRIIELDPNNPWYRNRLAVSALNLSNLYNKHLPESDEKNIWFGISEAEHFNASEIDPNNPLFQLNLAFFLHKTGRYKEAIPYYERTIEIDDRMLEAPYNLADIYNRLGDIEKSMAYYQFVYDRDPSFSNTLMALASYYLKMDDQDKALLYLVKAYEIKKPNERVMRNLIAIYDERQAYEQSIPIYETLFKRFPKTFKNYNPFYVRSLVRLRRIDTARDALERYVALYPDNKDAQKQLKALNQ